MLRVRQSNRLDRLADDLIEGLCDPTGSHPLEPELVVVQSPGMATWLRHRLAQRAGIAAAVEFPLPATLIWRLVRTLLPEAGARSPYEKGDMVWRLFGLLGPGQVSRADARFDALAGYLDDDVSGLKRFQLSQRIADVFDQYLVYRPDWIRRWQAGADGDDPLAGIEPWQPPLWRALVAATGGVADRAALQERARLCLEQDASAAALVGSELPPRIAVFGLSAMPPEQLRLLLALALHIDVDVYVFNPCRQYWSDIVSERYLARLVADETARDEAAPTHPYFDTGHPLLGALGRAGRDFVDLLLELGPAAEPEDAFVASGEATVLGQLQRDILDLDPGDAARLPVAADDHSIAFADCHGPLRELEALHDWLLARFEADASLTPRDVVVMIPDVDRYGPYVESVFGASSDAAQRIGFGISDRVVRGESPVLDALMTLLRLPDSRLTVSELLGILETPAVLRRFGLDEADLEQIAFWLDAAGVRWGRDAEHWRALGLLTDAAGTDPGAGVQANTWAFGVERMLLGYAMGGDAGPFRDALPLSGIEGSATAAVGALLDFLGRVDEFRARLRGPHTALTWAQIIADLVDAFFDESADPSPALGGVRQALVELAEAATRCELSETLTLEVVEALLEPALQAAGGGHRFLGGQVTFCTLMPMRTIPFRVVVMLGMNDADYPRREVPLGFDLLARFPRKGDRARRQEDRYLFLEAMLAARDHLYVSFSGRSPGNDSVQPCSVVVAELQQALAGRFVAADGGSILEQLTARHRLQPFSAAYGAADSGLVTYSPLWARAADAASRDEAMATSPVPLPERAPEARLALAALIGFLLDPCGRFLAERLDVRLGVEAQDDADDEPFVLGGLERYAVRTAALDALREGGSGEDLAALLARERLTGRVPHGAAGEEALAQARALLENYRERVGSLLDEPISSEAVTLEFAELVLEGEVGDCVPGGRVVLRAGKARERDRLRLWVAHLALAAMGSRRASLLVDAESVQALLPMSAATARQHLAALIELRDHLLRQPAPLLTQCSAAFAAAMRGKSPDPERALKVARKAWLPDRFGPSGEGENPAVARLWPEFPGDDPELHEAFVELAERVWGPPLDAITKLEEPDLKAWLSSVVADPDGDPGQSAEDNDDG